MADSFFKKVEKTVKNHKKRSKWSRIVMSIAMVVVFITTYMLILPAITMEKKTICGKEEHQHTEACYKEIPATKLLCEEQLPEIHQHTQDCYDDNGNLICGYADFILHTHTKDCYNEDGDLICPLEENKGHKHTKDCYDKDGNLICGEAESYEAHTHTKDCYRKKDGTISKVPVCGKLEVYEHVHNEKCFPKPEKELICGKEEHVHTKDCYADDEENDVNKSTEGSESTTKGAEEESTDAKGAKKDSAESDTEESGDSTQAESVTGKSMENKHAESGTNTAASSTDSKKAESTNEEFGNESEEAMAILEEASTSTNTRKVLRRQASRASANEGVSPQSAENEIDFTNNITKIDVKYKSGGDWIDPTIQDGRYQLSENDTVRFEVGYTLPVGTLSDQKNTITYQIPAGITIRNNSQGKVYDDSGVEVGTYTIGTDGKIRITFNETYVNKNKDTSAVTGYVRFEAKVSDITTDDSGKTDIKFKDNLNIGIKITDKTVSSEDLKVSKSATNIDKENNKITYTITVSSQGGTADKVNLSDIMENVSLDGDVTITDKDGNPVSATVNKENENKKFSLELPQMKAGDTYTLTYTAKLPSTSMNESVTAKNKVSVDSKKSDDIKIHDEASVENRVDHTIIRKSGEKTTDGKIKWTIVVNQDKSDIGGWTLSDIFNTQEFKGTVNITPSIAGSSSITLPYTFPAGTKDTYTITYITDADKVVGEGNTKNKAVMTPPQDSGKSGVDTGDQGAGDWDSYNPLKKTAQDISENADGNTATIKWKVTINADKGDIFANWTYTDQLWNKQWFTGEQIKQIKEALDTSLKNNNLNLSYEFKAKELSGEDNEGTEVSFDQVQTDKKYKTYSIVFKNTLEKGKSFSYEYTSTAPIEGIISKTEFRNQANINNKVWSNGSIYYSPSKPTIKKTDMNNAQGDKTSHDIEDLENGLLRWGITVSIPENYNGGALKVTDKLPEGLSLNYLEILADGVFGATNITAEGEHRIDNKYSVKVGKDGQTITVDIPENLANNTSLKEIRFVIKAKVADDYQWTKQDGSSTLTGVFANEATLKDKDDKSISSDGQEQTIYKNNAKRMVKKSCGQSEGDNHYEGNVIPYSIVINPDGADLLEGADTLTLKDVMSYSYSTSSVKNISLVPGSVKFYKYDKATQKKGEEITDGCSYVYSQKTDTEGTNITATNTLTMTIPDSQALLIEYKYKVNGAVGEAQWNIVNTASLEGIAEGDNSSGTTTGIKIQESSAGANIKGINICKVDSANNSKELKGAVFNLYRWNGTEYTPIQENGQNKRYVSGDDGMINIQDLIYNTAYKLVEIKAPDGYMLDSKPHYFYINSSDITNYPIQKPNGFKGMAYAGGSTMYRQNTLNKTNLSVNKKWFNKNGDDITDSKESGTIQFELWKKTVREDSIFEDATLRSSIHIASYNGDYISELNDMLNGTYPVGTTITFTIKNKYGNQKPTLYFNNDLLEEESVSTEEWNSDQYNKHTAYIYTYELTIASDDNTLTGHTGNDWTLGNWEFKRTSVIKPTTPDQDPVQDEKVDSYELNYGSDHWKKEFKDLPLQGSLKDGTLVRYTYYVKEVSQGNYSTSYVNNDGIETGTIEINNTVSDTYSLPETGGTGTILYIGGGLLLMVAAGALMYINQKNKRRDSAL